MKKVLRPGRRRVILFSSQGEWPPAEEGGDMDQTVTIIGYEQDCHCQHCGRALKHGIRISDGRVVGAQCFDKKLTAPRKYQGKNFRFGAEFIVRVAKVVEWKTPDTWARYGVDAASTIFTAVGEDRQGAGTF